MGSGEENFSRIGCQGSWEKEGGKFLFLLPLVSGLGEERGPVSLIEYSSPSLPLSESL